MHAVGIVAAAGSGLRLGAGVPKALVTLGGRPLVSWAVEALRAGGVVVFSSLTPHWTGPNTTDQMRSAYIVQYAPDGAEALRGDPSSPPIRRDPMDAPDRQYPVLVGGERVPPPNLRH